MFNLIIGQDSLLIIFRKRNLENLMVGEVFDFPYGKFKGWDGKLVGIHQEGQEFLYEIELSEKNGNAGKAEKVERYLGV